MIEVKESHNIFGSVDTAYVILWSDQRQDASEQGIQF